MRLFSTLNILLLFLFCLSFDMGAQSSIYKGLVVDSNKRESLPYVNIRIHLGDSTLSYNATDVSGRFNIIRGFPRGASVTVSCMGYKSKRFALVESNQLDTIFLSPDRLYLSEAIVFPANTEELSSFKTGTYRKSEDIYICRRAGNRSAILLEAKETFKQSILSRFGLLISDRSAGEHPFRIFFCEVSGTPDGRPGRVIPGSEIKAVSMDKGGWLYFDIDSLKIPFSPQGIYAVIEWLPQDTPDFETVSTQRKRGLAPVNHFCLAKYHCKYKDYLGWYQRPGDFEGWRRLVERKDHLVANPIVYASVLIIE
jgi:hypothetical protein